MNLRKTVDHWLHPNAVLAIATKVILLLIEPMRCAHSVLSWEWEWRDRTGLFVACHMSL
jgi:hypothetical protein